MQMCVCGGGDGHVASYQAQNTLQSLILSADQTIRKEAK